MITLKAIAIKTTSRATMQTCDSAEITVDKGITDDFHSLLLLKSFVQQQRMKVPGTRYAACYQLIDE